MPEAPNRALRLFVPIALVLGFGSVIFFAVSRNTAPKPAAPTSTTPAATNSSTPAAAPDPATPVDSAQTPPKPADSAAAPPTTPEIPTASAPPAPAPGALLWARATPSTPIAPIGDLTRAAKGGGGGRFQMKLEFAPFGAGLESLTLANHFEHIDAKVHETLQRHYPPPPPGDPALGAVAFAMEKIEIDGQPVNLAIDPRNTATSFWTQTAPGQFVATIVENDPASGGGGEKEIARITRRFLLAENSFELRLEQKLENLSGRPLKVRWFQFGPVDVPQGVVRYGGDVRRINFGFLLSPQVDPTGVVKADRFLVPHQTALGKNTRADVIGYPVWDITTLWPNDEVTAEGYSLAWSAMTGRYFAVSVYAPPPADPAKATPRESRVFDLIERIDRCAVAAIPDPSSGGRNSPGCMVQRLVTREQSVAPGATADASMMIYAGPMSPRIIESNPRAAAVWLEKVVVYTFGGPCGFCTFQPIARFLAWFLGLLHDYVVHDWALAIIVLVLCVRTCLHGVTRWSQLNMLRASKQMAALAPKQRAIQEKYKNDSAKLREELARLMREERVDYLAFGKGCVPGFLQMPIWLGLSAMLYFSFELRHSHAFFGVFQWISGHRWGFLGDLAEPDNFISFGRSFYVPFLSSLMGPIEGFNILPMLMGVIFYIQQKYLTPPPTAPLTPEQEQQQKIMKVMTVVMFPLFMYNSPAGLALYFMMNSTLAIIESKWIRAHADKIDIAAPRPPRSPRPGKPGKPGQPEKPGFLQRIQLAVEEQQRIAEQRRKQQPKGNGKDARR